MTGLSFLKDLFSGMIQFDSVIDNSDNSKDITVNINTGSGEPVVRQDGDELIVDTYTDELRSNGAREFMDKLKDGWDDGQIDEMVRASSSEKYSELEKTHEEGNVEGVKEYFKGKISDRHLDMVESALYFRELKNKGLDTKDLLEDIQKKYGEEGKNIANLVSAEYLDQGGYVRQLYEETDEEEQFDDRFEEIVKHQPFTVFVSNHSEMGEIHIELKRKLRKYNKYDVEFVDIRGIGETNRSKIKDTIELIKEEFGDFEKEERLRDGELRIRIDPESSDWKSDGE